MYIKKTDTFSCPFLVFYRLRLFCLLSFCWRSTPGQSSWFCFATSSSVISFMDRIMPSKWTFFAADYFGFNMLINCLRVVTVFWLLVADFFGAYFTDCFEKKHYSNSCGDVDISHSLITFWWPGIHISSSCRLIKKLWHLLPCIYSTTNSPQNTCDICNIFHITHIACQ